MKSSDLFFNMRGGEPAIADRAKSFRTAFGASSDVFIDIIAILEFKVREFIPDFKLMVRRDIELDVTASTTVDPPRIIVRETIYDAACEGDADARQILAHELGHLLLHWHIDGPMQKDPNGYRQQFYRMNLTESTERQADSFARHFLISPGIAYAHKMDAAELARVTGTSKVLATSAISISKRQEMYSLRSR